MEEELLPEPAAPLASVKGRLSGAVFRLPVSWWRELALGWLSTELAMKSVTHRWYERAFLLPIETL
jgi:hypothetical protein